MLVSLLLTGCASVFEKPYPDTCVVTQRDTQGPGYMTGTFPCRLKHVTVPTPKGP